MAQKEEITGNDPASADSLLQPAEQDALPLHIANLHLKHYLISKKVTDHLANERTFLAWIRTGLSIIAFGFVVERFGLLLRELGLKGSTDPVIPVHYSTLIGVTLIFLGIAVMIVALLNFLQARRAIDKDMFHPHRGFAVFLTILTCLIGAILAFYLYFTA